MTSYVAAIAFGIRLPGVFHTYRHVMHSRKFSLLVLSDNLNNFYRKTGTDRVGLGSAMRLAIFRSD
jgi:hypothetical protein